MEVDVLWVCLLITLYLLSVLAFLCAWSSMMRKSGQSYDSGTEGQRSLDAWFGSTTGPAQTETENLPPMQRSSSGSLWLGSPRKDGLV